MPRAMSPLAASDGRAFEAYKCYRTARQLATETDDPTPLKAPTSASHPLVGAFRASVGASAASALTAIRSEFLRDR